MTIHLICDHCQKSLRARDALAGKRLKCPSCGNFVEIPPGDRSMEASSEHKAKTAEGDASKSDFASIEEAEHSLKDVRLPSADDAQVHQPSKPGLQSHVAPPPKPIKRLISRIRQMPLWLAITVPTVALLAVLAMAALGLLLMKGWNSAAPSESQIAGASGGPLDTLTGAYRVRLQLQWGEADGWTYRETVESEGTPLSVERDGDQWSIRFFGQEWAGTTDELANLQLTVPVSSLDESLRSFHAYDAAEKASIALGFSAGEFTLTAQRYPTYVAPKTDVEVKSGPRPPGAISSTTIVETRRPGKAGFSLVEATLIDPSDEATPASVITGDRLFPGEVRRFVGHRVHLLSLGISSEGQFALSSDARGAIRRWSLDGREEPTTVTIPQTASGPVFIGPLADSGRVISATGLGRKARLQTWTIGSEEPGQRFELKLPSPKNTNGEPRHRAEWTRHFENLLVSADGQRALTVTYYGTHWATLWDVPSAEPIWSMPAARRIVEIAYSGERAAKPGQGVVALSPDGQRVVLNGHVWDSAQTDLGPTGPRQSVDLMTSVALPPRARQVAVGYRDNVICIWDYGAGQEVARCLGHLGPPLAMAYSADGNWLVSVGADETTRVWECTSGRQTRCFAWPGGLPTESAEVTFPAPVVSAAFTPDNRFVLSSDVRGTIHFWSLEEDLAATSPSPMIRVLADDGAVFEGELVAESANGKYRVVRRNARLQIWDSQLAKMVNELPDYVGLASDYSGRAGLTFSPGEDWFVTGCVTLWHPGGSVPVAEVKCPGDSACFTPDGRFILTGYRANADELFQDQHEQGFESLVLDAESLRTVERLKGAKNIVAFSPDNRLAVARQARKGSYGTWEDAGLAIYEISTGGQLCQFQLLEEPIFTPNSRYVVGIARDSTTSVGQAKPHGDMVLMNDATTGQLVRQFAPLRNDAEEHWFAQRMSSRYPSGHLNCLALSPDGQLLAVGTPEGRVLLFDVTTGRQVCLAAALPEPVAKLAFSPTASSLIVHTSVRDDAMIAMSAMSRSRPAYVLEWPDDASVRSSSRSPGVPNESQAPEYVPVATLPACFVMAFSPDGRYLALSGKRVSVWDLARRREVFRLAAADVRSLAFTPDGRGLLCGNEDKSVRLWDLPSGGVVCQFEGHGDRVTSVAVSHKGDLAASGSGCGFEGGTVGIQVLDLNTGNVVRMCPLPNDATVQSVNLLAFSPDDKQILGIVQTSSDMDEGEKFGCSSVRWWNVATGKYVRERWFNGNVIGVTADLNVALVRQKTSTSEDMKTSPLRLVEVNSGKEIRALRVPWNQIPWDGSAGNRAVSQDGKWAAVPDTTGAAFLLFDLAAGLEVFRYRNPTNSRLRGALFSPDSQHLAMHFGGDAASLGVLLWGPPSPIELGPAPAATATGPKNSEQVVLLKQQRGLSFAAPAESVGPQRERPRGPFIDFDVPRPVHVLPDGKRALVHVLPEGKGADYMLPRRELHLLDLESGKWTSACEPREMDSSDTTDRLEAGFWTDGDSLLTIETDHQNATVAGIRRWSLVSGQPQDYLSFSPHANDPTWYAGRSPSCFAVAPSGRWAAVGTTTGELYVVAPLEFPPLAPPAGTHKPTSRRRAPASNPAGDRQVLGRSAPEFKSGEGPVRPLSEDSPEESLGPTALDEAFGRSDVERPGETPRDPVDPMALEPTGQKGITALVVLSDNRSLLVGRNDGTIDLWDASAGSLLRRWVAHTHPVSDLVSTGEATRAVSVSPKESAVVWNVTTGEKQFELTPLPRRVALSPDGKLAACCSGPMLGVWDLDRQTRVARTVLDDEILFVAFLPSGSHILTFTRKSIKFWPVDAAMLPQSTTTTKD